MGFKWFSTDLFFGVTNGHWPLWTTGKFKLRLQLANRLFIMIFWSPYVKRSYWGRLQVLQLLDVLRKKTIWTKILRRFLLAGRMVRQRNQLKDTWPSDEIWKILATNLPANLQAREEAQQQPAATHRGGFRSHLVTQRFGAEIIWSLKIVANR